MRFELSEYHRNVTDQELLDDIVNVARQLNKSTITIAEYDNYGKYNSTTISRHFSSWNSAIKLTGLVPSMEFHSEVDLFENLANIWILLGHQPARRDLTKSVSPISYKSYERRFGSWCKALEAFVDYVNLESQEGILLDENNNTIIRSIKYSEHKTSRDINYRLRFKVMQRDNFKCCACGASPAKDPSVELHVDHIIPWSKGGETVMENLQTLCSKCNLGKSDLL